MSRPSVINPASVRRSIRLPATVALAAAAALIAGVGPARADVLPTLTAFNVTPTSVNVTTGEAHITVTMSVTDPDATGVGTGDVIARRPTRGYHPFGHLVQVGGTARNTQYRADITLPAGQALDYRMSISFMEADQFFLVDLNSQLYASGLPFMVHAAVTAPPAAARDITFHRELSGGRQSIVVSWAAPAAGAPVATGSTVTGTGCGTLSSSNAGSARFLDSPKPTTCAVTVTLVNGAGSSPPASASARL
jgi:hypothetical protein